MDLKTLNYKIGSLKSQLTLFGTFLHTMEINSSLTETDINNIRKRIERIEPTLSAFEEMQTEIEIATDSSEIDNLITREEFQNKYFSLLSLAESLIPRSESESIRSVHSNNSINQTIASHNPQLDSNSLSNVKLPRISLPTFKGDFTHWVEFYDTFHALVHLNLQISDAQKLCYLRASLQGEPANMIRSLKTSNDNYLIAWNLLKNRYDNKRRIIQTHVQSLLNLNHNSRENHTSLRIFMESAQNHMDCLTTLAVPVHEWDAIIIPILLNKLDTFTVKEWETKINNETNSSEVPTFTNFILFLRHKQATLESLASNRIGTQRSKEHAREQSQTFIASNSSCPKCKESHFIQKCSEFLKLNIAERIKCIKQLHLCINCLRKGHYIQDCKSSNCKTCNKKHNTLLHIATNEQTEDKSSETLPESISNTTSFMANIVNSQILLSTARVEVFNKTKKSFIVRALLDSASQLNFITDGLCKTLNLTKEKIDMSVTGINQGHQPIKYKTSVRIYSRCNNYNAKITCLVIPVISQNIPQISFDSTSLQIPKDIKLADTEFNKAAPVEILVGSSLFWTLLSVGQVKIQKNGPVLQKTRLGWIVAGNTEIQDQIANRSTYLSLETLHNELQQFWKIDEFIPISKLKTKDEVFCEDYFDQTTQKHSDGKFIVRIPFKPDLTSLGNSRLQAERRLYSLEKRFSIEPKTKSRYVHFMQDYLELGHMSNQNKNKFEISFFLPHHPVIKEDSETTKLRVVFDGSCKTDTGKSLNEVQHVGPIVQEELFSIILRFRTHTYVLTGDIEKMYRQIWVHPSDRKYQQILWREQASQDIEPYTLNTVTYGTTSAPYLATRCLYQLAKDCELTHPIESKVIQNDFYVDDLITGSNDINSLVSLKQKLASILNTVGFPLRKWNSNLPDLNDSNSGSNLIPLGKELHKLLGIFWNSSKDYFTFKTNHLKQHNNVSKRTILASTAQLFDPLGLLAPTIIFAKLIIQKLWHEKLSWDETIPSELGTQWSKFKTQLADLSKLKIPRHVLTRNAINIQMHGFADASERAYGACIYLRSVNNQNQVVCKLLAAKSRVAPLKITTLPRLELCAAVLLAQLMNKFRNILNLNINAQYLWSDSTIVLSWINSEPTRWKTFVANRVAEIQSISNPDNWHHVSTQFNAADPITRGVMPSDLASLNLWWLGPTWLTLPEHSWPNPILESTKFDASETQNSTVVLPLFEHQLFPIKSFSNLNTLKRIVAHCNRFIKNCQLHKPERNYNSLSVSEIHEAFHKLIKMSQEESFHLEIENLKKGKPLHSKSKLLSLNPFIDSEFILRVGGRLELSNFCFDKKHPILLDSNHHLTKLIFDHEHKLLMHPGANLLLASVRNNFWPISGRNIAKKTVRNCITCFRYKPQIQLPIMGNLPLNRTTMMPPFHTTGIDYAGPLLLKDRKGRGCKTVKAYISLFICFSTKAIHLELVSDLTTEGFIAAFRRFVARRGKPLHVYSDNGTNFKGASSELDKLYEFLSKNHESIKHSNVKEGINWHFIPVNSPHFGGLWEAGVKSVKHHLRRIMQNSLLTFEELCTILVQIESILNSRPLTPLSSDPNDIEALTPAHFLIGRTFTSLPDPNVLDVTENRLSRFQHLQQLQQHFWKRWNTEYINELQQRTKWKVNKANISIGTLVLVKADNQSPANWLLGRITALHPGRDKISRVATLKTQFGSIDRCVTKLCALPIE